MKRWRPRASRICVMPPPMIPTIIGSTTVSVNKVAIAASMALPPAASISAPATDASGWLLTTMPRLPDAGCFWQTNVVPARWRQWSVMMLSTSISNQPAYAGHFPSFRFRGDFFQLLLDEGCCAVIGIGPRHDRCQVLDNVPAIEMALDRRRVRNRQRPQDQSLSLNGRSVHRLFIPASCPARPQPSCIGPRRDLFLAFRAPKGRAAVLRKAPHDAVTAGSLAFLALAVVDLERMLEIAELAVGLAMLAQRRSARLDVLAPRAGRAAPPSDWFSCWRRIPPACSRRIHCRAVRGRGPSGAAHPREIG